jgi:hypothetical protein
MPVYTSGGRALGYYASVRLDLRPVGQLRDGGEVVGSRIRVQVTKNKVAPGWQVAELEVTGDRACWRRPCPRQPARSPIPEVTICRMGKSDRQSGREVAEGKRLPPSCL